MLYQHITSPRIANKIIETGIFLSENANPLHGDSGLNLLLSHSPYLICENNGALMTLEWLGNTEPLIDKLFLNPRLPGHIYLDEGFRYFIPNSILDKQLRIVHIEYNIEVYIKEMIIKTYKTKFKSIFDKNYYINIANKEIAKINSHLQYNHVFINIIAGRKMT